MRRPKKIDAHLFVCLGQKRRNTEGGAGMHCAPRHAANGGHLSAYNITVITGTNVEAYKSLDREKPYCYNCCTSMIAAGGQNDRLATVSQDSSSCCAFCCCSRACYVTGSGEAGRQEGRPVGRTVPGFAVAPAEGRHSRRVCRRPST